MLSSVRLLHFLIQFLLLLVAFQPQLRASFDTKYLNDPINPLPDSCFLFQIFRVWPILLNSYPVKKAIFSTNDFLEALFSEISCIGGFLLTDF